MAVAQRKLPAVRMADIGAKPPTLRNAVARCELVLQPETAAAIKAGTVPKGDVWPIAQTAGILAAKRTTDLIPLCHPIPISHVALRYTFEERCLVIEAAVTTTAPTGRRWRRSPPRPWPR